MSALLSALTKDCAEMAYRMGHFTAATLYVQLHFAWCVKKVGCMAHEEGRPWLRGSTTSLAAGKTRDSSLRQNQI